MASKKVTSKKDSIPMGVKQHKKEEAEKADAVEAGDVEVEETIIDAHNTKRTLVED